MLTIPAGVAAAEPRGASGGSTDVAGHVPVVWHEHQHTMPEHAFCSAMAYDAQNERMVLFGGRRTDDTYLNPTELNDTWAWDGSEWERLDITHGPSRRLCARLAYDPVRQETVLFGGEDHSGSELTDTWVLQDDLWTLRHPAVSPPGGYGQSMAFDPRSQRVILFGGWDRVFHSSETWAWDGSTWTKLQPAESPGGRYGGGLALDPERDALVLFGGQGSSGALNDTWSWDGENWTNLSLRKSPTRRIAHMATFGQQVVLFGGRSSASDETWILRERRWVQLHPHPAPPGRVLGAMAWDPGRSEVVLVGGLPTPPNDSTWTLNLKQSDRG